MRLLDIIPALIHTGYLKICNLNVLRREICSMILVFLVDKISKYDIYEHNDGSAP